MSKPKGNGVEWIEGLRGVASLVVMTSHIALAFWPWVNDAALDEQGNRMLMQWPILRAFMTGMLPVAMFVVISGVVNCLKPTRQMRAGNVDDALAGIALSTFRRTGRFVFPVFFLTAISWAMCQLGLFAYGHSSMNGWVSRTSPAPSASIGRAMYDLLYNIWTTWTQSGNIYDENMWLLKAFLAGSFQCYLTLMATSFVVPSRRFLVYALLYAYNYGVGESLIGLNICAGMFFAELMQTGVVAQMQERYPLRTYWTSSVVVFVGLYIASFPENHSDWSNWSHTLEILGRHIFPDTDVSRFWAALGAQMLFVGILFNTGVQRLLTARWVTACGKVSWQIYLVHGTLLRTLLQYLTYAMSGSQPGAPVDSGMLLMRFAVSLPVFYIVVYLAACAWAATIDPLCSRITDWIEKKLFRQDVLP